MVSSREWVTRKEGYTKNRLLSSLAVIKYRIKKIFKITKK